MFFVYLRKWDIIGFFLFWVFIIMNSLFCQAVVSGNLSLVLSRMNAAIHFSGIKKRLVSAGKLKSLVGLQDWVQATVKHLYWCAESSDGAPDEILPKWTSLVGHVADLHEHANPLYPRCQHGDLGKKKWLPEGK